MGAFKRVSPVEHRCKNPLVLSANIFRDLARYHVPEALLSPLRTLRSKLAPPIWTVRYTAALRQRALGLTVKPAREGKKFANANGRTIYQRLTSRNDELDMEMHNKWAAMTGVEIAFPMLDGDLIGFIMGIPGEVRNGREFPEICCAGP